jgi:energy-coupling factor transporter ATP-binding protein EcfA2
MVVSNKEKMKALAFEANCEIDIPVIVVAGVTSGAGKTSLAEAITGILSKHLPTAAAKITVTHGERGCPHGGKGCDVCGSLGGEYQVITRSSIITQPGTDTARLLESGACRVLWTITREEFIAAAWREMMTLLSGAKSIVVESNTLALTIKPARTLMVVDPTVSRRLWKPSAERLIAAADFLVFNDRGPEHKRQELLAEIERLRGSTQGLLFVAHPHEIELHTAFMASLLKACGEISTQTTV